MSADATKIAEHIRGRIAKSGLDSPSINITRDGWALILALLDRKQISLDAAATLEYAARGYPNHITAENFEQVAELRERGLICLCHIPYEGPGFYITDAGREFLKQRAKPWPIAPTPPFMC
jgi:hypothetical protein